MAFPNTPTNGQQSVVNGITYQYASATNSWTRVPGIAGNISASGNVTAANFLTAGTVSATGNISGNYFLGNGALLTGISASGSGNSISNGTSNVAIPTANGSVYISDNGVSNAAVFSNGSFAMAGSFATPKTTTANSIVPDNVNAMLIGPVDIGNGTTISVPSSSTLYVFSNGGPGTSSAYSNVDVSAYLASGSDSANIVTTANISGNYILGNGYFLSGISGGAGYGNSNVSLYLASGSDSANIVTTGNITSGNITTSGLISATGNITSAANISGGYILGNGSQLTGLPATYGNANVVANLAALGSNPVSTTGNITSGNLLTSGVVSSTGNITGGNLRTAGVVSATGNITGGNISTAGNISGNYLTGNGSQITGIDVLSPFLLMGA
jgi:hypothetical protein